MVWEGYNYLLRDRTAGGTTADPPLQNSRREPMRPSTLLGFVSLACALALAQPAPAQPARPRAGAPAPAATPAPASTTAATPLLEPTPAAPQQTTATFEDWTLRCTRPPPAPGTTPGATPPQQFCELVQTVTSGDKTVAQIALGRAGKGQPLLMTVLAPVSVSFGRPVSLVTAKDADAATLDLPWRRCVPGGCLADAPVPDELIRRIQAWTEPARIAYADAGGRAIALPFSARGLPLALGALAKSEAE